MTARDERQRLHALLWALADSFDDATLAEPTVTPALADRSRANAVRATLLAGMQAGRKRRLQQAREEREEALHAYLAAPSQLPMDAIERRQFLERIVTKRPEAKELVLTLQHRELTDLSDDDVASLLRQFAHLGLLKNVEGK